MVHINVDVEDSRMMKEQLKDSKNDVIDIAKSRSFSFFGMVQPP